MIRLPKLKITKKSFIVSIIVGTVPGLFLGESKETRFWAFVPVIDAPRLDISLKKNTATLKFDLDLPVAEFQAMVFAKKYFRTGSIFFEFTNCSYIFSKKHYI